MPVLRVAIVEHATELSGRNLDIIQNMTRRLKEKGESVTVFYAGKANSGSTNEVGGVPAVAIPHKRMAPPFNAFVFPIFLMNVCFFSMACSHYLADFDVINTFHPIVAAVLSRRLGRPVIYTSGMADILYSPRGLRRSMVYKGILIPMEVLGARCATKVICLSEDIKSRYESLLRRDRQKFVAIPLGVDLELFNPSKRSDRARAAWGLNDTFAIIFVGRVNYLKGFDVLIESLGRLKSKPTPINFTLLVAGYTSGWRRSGGSFFSGLSARISELGLEHSVRFLGYMDRTRLSELLANCDVFVLPSRMEGISNAVVESMASGIVSVASRARSCEETIDSSGAGLVVERENIEQLTEILFSLANSDDEVSRLGKIGREVAVSKYSWDKIVTDLEKVYSAVAAESASPESRGHPEPNQS